MTGRLQDKVALITGAGSGIGEACMVLFAEQGARVIGCGRRLETLQPVLEKIEKSGGQGRVYEVDLARHEDAVQLVEKVIAGFGFINILVHSAGVGVSWARVSENSINDIAATPHDKWQEVMQINLEACYSMCHAVLPGMLARGVGSIVTISSIGGLRGSPSAHTYAAAKADMINLTQSMAMT